ncbi:type III secretion system export apparatus subunit SctR [Chlamydiales bacterium]|nr:type III secretion system export apparatus subunit SctR [Chlamydiales bacterium]
MKRGFTLFLLFMWVLSPIASIDAQEVQTEETQPIERRAPSKESPKKVSVKGGRIKEESTDDKSNDSDDILSGSRPSLLLQALVIVLMATLPFAIMLLTPFVKFVVVLSMLRTALGVQNSPPNMVINGISLMMSLFIMYPTAGKMYDAAQPVVAEMQSPTSILSADSPKYIITVLDTMKNPLKDYLQRNSSVKHQRLFYRMAYKGIPEALRTKLTPNDLIILIPSYITGQLKQAFEVGVLIYIPFFVIDLVVSNILLAMGMMMLSPVTISMPLKLFLLVMLDGWTVLIDGLVQTFR